MKKSEIVKTVQKIPRKLFNAICNLNHGPYRIKRIPMGGLAHMVLLREIKVGNAKYTVGYHPDDYTPSFLLFNCAHPEDCIEHNPIVVRITGGVVSGPSGQQIVRSDLSLSVNTVLNSKSKTSSLSRAITMVIGELHKVQILYHDPRSETVPIAEAMKYTPYTKEKAEYEEQPAGQHF